MKGVKRGFEKRVEVKEGTSNRERGDRDDGTVWQAV
jgi:hypothetical protein